MKWVHLVEFDAKERTGKAVATCILENDQVHCEGNTEIVAQLKDGVFSPFKNKKLTPEDGEAFLKALSVEFRSVYLFATDVQEGVTVLPYKTPPMHKIS